MKTIFKIPSLVISIIFFALQPVQAEELNWATQAGGLDSDQGHAIAVDVLGNSYVTGTFEGSATFGAGGANETTLTNSSTFFDDSFVAKYTSSGDLLWAKQASGPRFIEGRGVAVDGSENAYVTGLFLGSATFGAGEANETTLNSAGGLEDRDIYIAKYHSGGNLLWAKQAGGSDSSDTGESIAADSLGNSYVTGAFSGSATFGSGEPNETILSSSGNGVMFVAKYDTGGNLLWAKQAVGLEENSGSGANGIAVDSLGDTYVTGLFLESMTFGAGEANETTLHSSGGSDIFVAKYKSSGDLLWAKQAGSADLEGEDWGNGIAVDGSQHSYVVGFFSGSATFGAGEANETILSSSGNVVMFVAKYDSNGNLHWAKKAGGSVADPEDGDLAEGRGIAVDGAGDSYVTGLFRESMTFGAGEANETTLHSSGGFNVFVAKYRSSGNFLWAKQAGTLDSSDAVGQSIAVDGSRNSYVAGYFTGSVTFGAGEANETILDSSNDRDIFVASYSGTAELRLLTIDIKPGNKRNAINPRAKGGIWVAILSDTDSGSPFDPSSQVDIPTVEFGPDGAKVTRYRVKDINKDGLGDLLLRFKIPETGIACGDTEATLTGETFDGQNFTGTDAIKTVGCPKHSIPGTAIQSPDNGHWYDRFDSSMTWHDAKTFCNSLGGYVATLTSPMENDFVYDHLVTSAPRTGIWLGATDEVKEGVWRWITGEDWNITSWANGEPNNCAEIEHYLTFYGQPYLWNDLGSCENPAGEGGGAGCGGCPEDWEPMSTICEWDFKNPKKHQKEQSGKRSQKKHHHEHHDSSYHQMDHKKHHDDRDNDKKHHGKHEEKKYHDRDHDDDHKKR